MWPLVMPGLFVLLWSSGFIGAKFGLPYSPPFTFLLTRFLIVTALLLLIVLVSRASWPKSWAQAGHIAIAGLFIHATYLGGVFNAIYCGVPAGVTALIVSLQPLLTAILVGPLFGEEVRLRQWGGFVLGIVGVGLVVMNKLSFQGSDFSGFAFSIMALFGITSGTLYQKKFCSIMDLRTGAVLQYAATTCVMLIVAPITETMAVEWTGEFIFALIWLILVLSVGAVFLLFLLIRRGEAARVVSLFYLVPPMTALLAFFVFGETLGPLALLGMAIAVAGVALVNR